MYFSLLHGGTVNGGHRVLDEGPLLDVIRELPVERGKGEQLVLFHE